MSGPEGVCSRGGCLLPGGLLWGVWSWGVCSGGVSAPRRGGGIPARTEADPPLTESQTLVKTLPWPNFVAAGNNKLRLI